MQASTKRRSLGVQVDGQTKLASQCSRVEPQHISLTRRGSDDEGSSCSSDHSSCSGRTDYCPKEPVEAQAARQTGDQNPTPAKLEPQEEVQAKPHQTPEPQMDACDGKAVQASGQHGRAESGTEAMRLCNASTWQPWSQMHDAERVHTYQLLVQKQHLTAEEHAWQVGIPQAEFDRMDDIILRQF